MGIGSGPLDRSSSDAVGAAPPIPVPVMGCQCSADGIDAACDFAGSGSLKVAEAAGMEIVPLLPLGPKFASSDALLLDCHDNCSRRAPELVG